MFLDEELESIFKENGFNEDTSYKLMQACFRRLPDPKNVRGIDFMNDLRKVESGWKLFCKRHEEFRPDGFRYTMMKLCSDILTKPALEYLHWDKPE